MNIEQTLAKIKENRPNLSQSSLRTYSSILRSLFYQFQSKSVDFNGEYFIHNCQAVLDHLKPQPANIQKTKLSPLVVLMDALGSDKCAKKYREVLEKNSEQSRIQEEAQQMTEKQKANWISWDEVLKTRSELEKTVKPLWSKLRLTDDDRSRLQSYVILCVYTMIPPRRLDYAVMKMREYNKETDNYLDIKEKKMVFNIHKTFKTYGRQEDQLPRELFNILNRWKKLMLSYNYMFENGKGDPLSTTALNRALGDIFEPKKISCSMLRHIYISDVVLKNAPRLQELQAVAEQMGHSVQTQALYRKIDDEPDRSNGASSSSAPGFSPEGRALQGFATSAPVRGRKRK